MYKKTIISLFLILTTGLLLGHAFYISMTQIVYNPEKKAFDIKMKLFSEDLEGALRNYKEGEINLMDADRKKETEQLLSGQTFSLLLGIRFETSLDPLARVQR